MKTFITIKCSYGSNTSIRANSIMSVYEDAEDNAVVISTNNDESFKSYESFDSIMKKLEAAGE